MYTYPGKTPGGLKWKKYDTHEVSAGHGETRTVRGALLPPYGDDPHDQEMIKAGVKYYNTNKKNLKEED